MKRPLPGAGFPQKNLCETGRKQVASGSATECDQTFSICFFHILGIIIPTDFHIFQRDVHLGSNSAQISYTWTSMDQETGQSSSKVRAKQGVNLPKHWTSRHGVPRKNMLFIHFQLTMIVHDPKFKMTP